MYMNVYVRFKITVISSRRIFFMTDTLSAFNITIIWNQSWHTACFKSTTFITRMSRIMFVLFTVALLAKTGTCDLTRLCETGCLDSVCYFGVGCMNCAAGYCNYFSQGSTSFCLLESACEASSSCTVTTVLNKKLCIHSSWIFSYK